jgi:hypothetical protein
VQDDIKELRSQVSQSSSDGSSEGSQDTDAQGSQGSSP